MLEADDGELVYECGRCGDGWYAASDDSPLDDELSCRACSFEVYRRIMPRPRPAGHDNGRTVELWRREAGWADVEPG